ncbi:MAG TPA: helix-turn-helix domain-containing protein [Hydrogenophaga sp.]|uniref:helix-turn-helix domain-containing protein n=1 Tax=Hydrogenophaga sp. TaxID=1904254 RepID=UPI002C8F6562|nr:helix-turn-helix domain-containing protein [Hydrogenophaga sp.]HSX95373.1 helix-turn-helix domain-containing protein [Hydrogenophaga sp.]
MFPADALIAASARRWSTEAVPPERRLDYWVGAICEAFLEMDCSSREARHFDGRLVSLARGPLSFNQVEATTQDVYRTPAAIARGARQPFYLITQRRTPWHVVQGGQRLGLRPGDAVLVDSACAYELHFTQSVEALSIQLPRAWVGQWLRALDEPAARVAWRDQGWGQALSAWCLQFAHEPGLASQVPEHLLSDQLGAMLAAALEPAVAPTRSGRDLAARAETLMRDRLDSAGLQAAELAQALGVSLRTLHRAFAAGGTSFADTLRGLRLRRAAELLVQPRLAGLSVAEIGRRCGYADASHFVREFQRRHALTPARWRRERLAH